MRSSAILVLATVAALLVSSGAAIATIPVSVTVPGTADPWLAGMPDGSIASANDTAPGQSPTEVAGIDLITGDVLTFDVSGSVSFTPANVRPPVDPPDGGSLNNFSHYNDYPILNPENGISDINAPQNSLVGVFLGPDRPDASPAPAALDFGTTQSRDYATLSPTLKQIFFIGDGRTSTGEVQKVTIPNGATRLFLGPMDGVEWSNNSGSFSVQVRHTPSDTTEPTPSLPPDITKTTTDSNGSQVMYTATATDDVDGNVPIDCSPASGTTFPLGTTTVNCAATDQAGNQATGTFKVNVLYDFGNGSGGGFSEPVTNGALNQVKAGAGVPVKFGLGANLGLDIFAVGYPTSRKITCDSQQVIDPIEETVAVSSSGLKYDSASGQYIYNWKTDKAWSSTCRQLVIKLKDGSEHPINFKFK